MASCLEAPRDEDHIGRIALNLFRLIAEVSKEVRYGLAVVFDNQNGKITLNRMAHSVHDLCFVSLCVDLSERHSVGEPQSVNRNSEYGHCSILADLRSLVITKSDFVYGEIETQCANMIRGSHIKDRNIMPDRISSADRGKSRSRCCHGLKCQHSPRRTDQLRQEECVLANVGTNIYDPISVRNEPRQDVCFRLIRGEVANSGAVQKTQAPQFLLKGTGQVRCKLSKHARSVPPRPRQSRRDGQSRGSQVRVLPLLPCFACLPSASPDYFSRPPPRNSFRY